MFVLCHYNKQIQYNTVYAIQVDQDKGQPNRQDAQFKFLPT